MGRKIANDVQRLFYSDNYNQNMVIEYIVSNAMRMTGIITQADFDTLIKNNEDTGVDEGDKNERSSFLTTMKSNQAANPQFIRIMAAVLLNLKGLINSHIRRRQSQYDIDY